MILLFIGSYFSVLDNYDTNALSLPTSATNNPSNDPTANLQTQVGKSIQVLHTPYVKEYSIPNGTWPNGLLVDSNGTVWTVGTRSQNLLKVDPRNGQVLNVYPLKNQDSVSNNRIKSRTGVMMVWAMVEGKDGSIWFSQSDSSNPLWRFDRNTSKFEIFRTISSAPFQMKVEERTGNIWFTTFASGNIGVIQRVKTNTSSITDSSNYQINEFSLGKASYPSGLFLDGDSLWVTETLDDKIIKLRIVTDIHGKVIDLVKLTEISGKGKKDLFSAPYDVVRLGNSLWVTEHDANFIAKYDLTSNSVTKVAVSNNPHQYISLPFWLKIGPDDKSLWFNEHTGNRISFINTTNMQLTEYEIPTRDPSTGYISNVLNFAVDPLDRNRVWFSEYNYDKIGLVDRHIPISFGIKSNLQDITISTNNQHKFSPEAINLQIMNEPTNVESNGNGSDLPKNSISFKISSSMTPFGSLKNISSEFIPDGLNIASLPKITPIQLRLSPEQETEIYPGNYTLGVSATDDYVTKTIFLNLIIK